MKKYLILIVLSFFVFCKGEKSLEEKVETIPEEHHHEEIKVPIERQREWGIEFDKVSHISISSKINVTGIITLNKNKTAHVTSLVEGKVVSLSADLGNPVKEGQILLTINSPEFSRAKADFLKANAIFELKKKEYERAKALLEQKAIEKKEFLRREAEYSSALVDYDFAKCNLKAIGFSDSFIDRLITKYEYINKNSNFSGLSDPFLPVISPISGRVIFRDVVLGEYIPSEKILFTISDLSTLWAILDVYEKDLPYVNKNSIVKIRPSLYPEKEYKGKITYISDIIDEKLRTIKIRVEVENKENFLKPNMFVEAKIENINKKEKLLYVPEEAVQNFNGRKIVFIKEEEDIFVPKEIKIKGKIDNKIIISEGLEYGQKIVTKGSFYLKAELNKESFGEAHVH